MYPDRLFETDDPDYFYLDDYDNDLKDRGGDDETEYWRGYQEGYLKGLEDHLKQETKHHPHKRVIPLECGSEPYARPSW